MESKSKGKGIGCLSLIIVILTLWIVFSNCGGGGPSAEHDPIMACVMSQTFAKDRLKAPATAKFASYQESQVTDKGNGEYLVSSHVDAENSFGAKVRTKYICRLKYTGNNRWQMLEFRFLE